jgi:hypothetical protein
MPGPTSRVLTAAAGLAVAASACSMPSPRETAMPTSQGNAPAALNMMPVRQWPIRFDSHKFSVHCYDTYGCHVEYDDIEQRDDPADELRPSSVGYGPDYQRNWGGGHGMIRNFPPPAQVRWRSKDGIAHETEIDIAALFADEMVRHRVPREDVANMVDGEYQYEPSIILEINDRTIRVWMRAWIPLKREVEVAGVMRNDRRYELMLVETYTY